MLIEKTDDVYKVSWIVKGKIEATGVGMEVENGLAIGWRRVADQPDPHARRRHPDLVPGQSALYSNRSRSCTLPAGFPFTGLRLMTSNTTPPGAPSPFPEAGASSHSSERARRRPPVSVVRWTPE